VEQTIFINFFNEYFEKYLHMDLALLFKVTYIAVQGTHYILI